ncbi:hypothetical protein [Escherichia coli]|nr:hypothetical protein [Escherichia coli]
MNGKSRLASYVPKGKEKQAMKQQKAMLIARPGGGEIPRHL